MKQLIIRLLSGISLLLLFCITGCQNHNLLKSIVAEGPEPTADFSYAIDKDNLLKVTFTNNSQNQESVYWKFGDGTASTDNSPTHLYPGSGTYEVVLTTRSAAGYSSDTTIVLTVKQAEVIDFRHRALHGRSAVVSLHDPFRKPYWNNRSDSSIADEIALAGYTSVHYMVVNELYVDAKLVDELHKRGIAVWLLVFACGTYDAWGFPSDFRTWEADILNQNGSAAGFYHFSPWSTDYVTWKKEQLARLVSTIPFDGVELFESFLPNFVMNGNIGSTTYGDIGPHAQQAFLSQYGVSIPNFTDPSASNYYKTDKDLYHKWVQFRIDGISNMLSEIIDGEGGVKEVRPDILVGVWGLGVNWGGAVALEREYEAQDIRDVINTIHPDIYFLETNWPDWIKTNLPPDYITGYQPFVDSIKSADPNMLIGIQTDYGSHANMIRSPQWMKDFDSVSASIGYSTYMGYEYAISGDMYYTPPHPLVAKRLSGDSIMISFSKRIDEQTALQTANYSFKVNGVNQSINITHISVDGNRVIIHATNFPTGAFEVYMNNIKDTPGLLLFKNKPANTVPANSSVEVP